MMRALLTLVFLCVLTSAAASEVPGTAARITKSTAHVRANPASDSFLSGEDGTDAIVIDGLPFMDAGATCDNLNDYDVDCPASGPGSPDVVYSYVAESSGSLKVDLCGSLFDTKLLVFDLAEELIACNDDAYLDETCGQYTSLIANLEVTAGELYFIVVDGYGGDCGAYVLNVSEATAPAVCGLACGGESEGEPTLTDGYVDLHNGGCNSAGLGYPFQDLGGDIAGELNFCGTSGWYDSATRDTDWFIAIIGAAGQIEWTLDAEQWVQGRVLGPLDCGSSTTIQEFAAGPCLPASLTIQGAAGDLVWFWVAPVGFVPPAGFEGHEFKYTSSFSGLQSSSVATEETTWGGIKSMYR
jgi:hypothetical protein